MGLLNKKQLIKYIREQNGGSEVLVILTEHLNSNGNRLIEKGTKLYITVDGDDGFSSFEADFEHHNQLKNSFDLEWRSRWDYYNGLFIVEEPVTIIDGLEYS
jgi:hypothetical protein